MFSDCSDGDYLQLLDDLNPDEEYKEKLCGDLSKWTPIVAVFPDPYDNEEEKSKTFIRQITAKFSSNRNYEGSGFSCRIFGHKRKNHVSTPVLTTTTTLAPLNCPTADEYYCNCGRVKALPSGNFSDTKTTTDSSLDFKIRVGVETIPNQYPWQVGLEYKDFLYCGGSLISKKYVLTAAHCTNYFQSGTLVLSDLKVLFGEHDLTTSHDCAYRVAVKRLFQHSAYNENNFDHDFSILELEREIDCTDHVGPICLPDSVDTLEGESVTASGWGVTEEGASSTKLQHVDVFVYPNEYCKDLYDSEGYTITDAMLCAADHEKDTCQGDSGGPLMFYDYPNKFQIVGVTSWGIGCADERFPGVYSRVSSVLPWIKKILKSSRTV